MQGPQRTAENRKVFPQSSCSPPDWTSTTMVNLGLINENTDVDIAAWELEWGCAEGGCVSWRLTNFCMPHNVHQAMLSVVKTLNCPHYLICIWVCLIQDLVGCASHVISCQDLAQRNTSMYCDSGFCFAVGWRAWGIGCFWLNAMLIPVIPLWRVRSKHGNQCVQETPAPPCSLGHCRQEPRHGISHLHMSGWRKCAGHAWCNVILLLKRSRSLQHQARVGPEEDALCEQWRDISLEEDALCEISTAWRDIPYSYCLTRMWNPKLSLRAAESCAKASRSWGLRERWWTKLFGRKTLRYY